ncbi:MAG: spore cortex biosynthesis protein YabQ [Lachnospiraceae bacterium]|nr:spore cortex biosynthesis protein YabQ [Lachnospiraceae bacterium]
MSQNIISEVMFFFHSFLMGIVITFVYDGFLVLRRVIRHNLLLISLEDMVFWIACAIGVFYMLYEENNGVLRWFAVFGAALGMIVYKESISSLIVNFLSKVLSGFIHLWIKVFGLVFRPVCILGRKACRFLGKFLRKGKRAGKSMKKKLTKDAKLLKITLCRQKERDC